VLFEDLALHAASQLHSFLNYTRRKHESQFQFQKRRQQFVSVHDEPLSVAAMCVRRSRLHSKKCNLRIRLLPKAMKTPNQALLLELPIQAP
jgi:hypothetical protein